MHKRVDNSCRWRSEYLYLSFVIVLTERGQWQPSFIQEKSAYFAEVSVMEQILWKFPNSQKFWGNWACANSVYQAFFPYPRTRAWEQVPPQQSSVMGVLQIWQCNQIHKGKKTLAWRMNALVTIGKGVSVCRHGCSMECKTTCRKNLICKLLVWLIITSWAHVCVMHSRCPGRHRCA